MVAYSSGNHAQAVALAGKLLGVRAVIVMPDDAPAVKLDATRGYGAEVIIYDRERQDREQLARELAEKRDLTVIPPFDHPHVVAGQGTAAKELIEDIGALAASALLEGKLDARGKRVGVIISGGNVDLKALARLL